MILVYSPLFCRFEFSIKLYQFPVKLSRAFSRNFPMRQTAPAVWRFFRQKEGELTKAFPFLYNKQRE